MGSSPGWISNRFEMQDLLGRGGMGEVYKAIDAQTGATVAIKALNPEILERQPDLLERFQREGQALRQLNHPNIIHMLAAVEEDGRHYLVMEYVGGGSLQDLLQKEGRLAPPQAVRLGLEIADALTRAHHLGIIHRDLKPANVLLAADGTSRLSDFGIAYQAGSQRLTQTGILIGTVDYLSPEVCQGEPPDEKADIWSFGVLLFEMLSGRLPFEGKNLTARITAILTQPVPDLAQLAPATPDALADLVYRMLEKNPQERISSVRLVGAELDAIQKGRKVSGLPAEKRKSPQELPAFLEQGIDVEPPIFVTRESELAQLDRFLNESLAGHGRVAFLTGDAGLGKTALADEFARRAQKSCAELLVASGSCNAYTGIGDPYLPFREILGLLCGDIESRWEARAISREQASRLWQCLPLTVQALVESGRDLVEIFISGDTLVRRAAAFPAWQESGNWLPRLQQLVQLKATAPVDPNFQQAALFEQFTRVLRVIARQKPLLMILDDLQWADSGSISLLFHLGKRLEGSRVMILCTYRSSEVALGRGGERHPLEPIVHELKRQFGEIHIDLSKSDGRRFVDAYVDTVPNRLGEEFRATLARLTGGQPLGTVELLREMQERGSLVRDNEGCWGEGPALDWERLPARLEAMIAERIERLDDTGRQVLRVASVEGETFTAEVIAQVLGEEPQFILSLLSNELDKRHHLVRAQNIRQVNGKRLSIYRFQHILFQRYLQGSLDVIERSNLHQSVGAILKDVYAERQEEISSQLAHHFREAGIDAQAADYLVQAGDRAVELYAYQEALDDYQQAQAAYQQSLGIKWNLQQRAELERKIGETLFRKGEHPLALEHLKKALANLGRPLPDSRWGIRLAILVELFKQLGHRLIPGLFKAQGSLPLSAVVQLEIQLYESIGWLSFLSNPEGLLLVALKNLNVSESCGFSEGIVGGGSTLAAIMDYIGLFELSEPFHRRSIALAEVSQNPRELGISYLTMSSHQECLGQLDSAYQFAVKSADAFGQAGDSHQQWFMVHFQADILYNLGKLIQSLETSKLVVLQGQEKADPQIECWGLVAQGGALLRLGNLPAAIKALEEAIKLGEAIPDYGDRIEAGGELGWCYLRQGQIEKALSVLGETRNILEQQGAGWGNDIPVFYGLAEAYLVIAEQDPAKDKTHRIKARRLCHATRKRARNNQAGMPETLWLQGRCDWLEGKKRSAQKWWIQSLKMAREHGQRYDEGITLLEMGSRLGERGYLEEAIAIFTEIGAEWDLARARQALQKQGQQNSAP